MSGMGVNRDLSTQITNLEALGRGPLGLRLRFLGVSGCGASGRG